jgi:hypothetical protein
MNIFKLLGSIFGFRNDTDTPTVTEVPKKVVTSSSGGSGKLHIAELYKQKPIKQNKLKHIKQDDEDILALLGFMISNKLIT